MRPRITLGDAEHSDRPGAFEPLSLAASAVVHRCAIYEKFYHPKWHTHHLKEDTLFLHNDGAILSKIIVCYQEPTWSSVVKIINNHTSWICYIK